MARYVEPLLVAIDLFLFIAAVFTLPYVIYSYRKYGSLLIMRILCVYAFIFYLICVYCLAILPFPKEGSVPTQKVGLNLIPFSYVPEILTKTVDFSISDPSTWMPAFFSSGIYEPILNILMFLPLGVFLRYYFGWNMKRTVLCAFLLSFFLEFTQYTATYGLAPYRYRLADVNDLIDNTLGGFLGYLVTPLLTFMLPSRERLNQVSYQRGTRVSYVRRIVAYGVDEVICSACGGVIFFVLPKESWLVCLIVIAYNTLIPYFWQGRTPGKALVRIRVVDSTTHERATLKQYAQRMLFLHLIPRAGVLLNAIGIESTFAGVCGVLLLGMMFIQAVFCGLRNKPQMFYERWTNTIQVCTNSHRQKAKAEADHSSTES